MEQQIRCEEAYCKATLHSHKEVASNELNSREMEYLFNLSKDDSCLQNAVEQSRSGIRSPRGCMSPLFRLDGYHDRTENVDGAAHL